MPNITKPNDVNTIWAATSDSVAAPSNEYILNGWEAIIPPKEYFNWLDNRQDRFNAHVNQHGIPVWDANTEYQAGLSYSKGSDGTVYKAITTNSNVNPVGDNTGAWGLAFSTAGIRRFTSSGSFTVPAGITTVYLSGTAAGGGGGGGAGKNVINNTTAGGGGGGGAGQSVTKVPITVTPGQVIAVNIGAPGVAGSGGGQDTRGSDATSAGNLNFGSLLTLTGGGRGRGGETGSGAGGQGGSPGGAWGTDGIIDSKAGDGGSGGSGPYGTAGGGGRAGSSAGQVGAATVGAGYGTGGGGGGGSYSTFATGIGANGSAGMPGLLIIEWF